MFKNIIVPVQAWLLSQGKCVGCGKPLKDGKKSKAKTKGDDLVTCQCGRVFISDQKTKGYRRAKFSEL